ncbi:MAG: hypothetical protein AAGJ46_21045 [Planctomycetota bacterium]
MLWLIAGQSAWAGAQWLLVLAATHWTSSAVVGLYALALGTSTPIFRFFNSGFRLYATADIHDRFDRRAYVNGRLIGVTAAMLLSLGVWLLHAGVSGVALMAAVVLAKSADALSDLTYGFSQKRSRFDRVGISMIVRACLGLVVAVGMLAWTGSLGWAVLGMGVIWLSIFYVVDRRALEAEGETASTNKSTHLYKRLAPLAFVAALASAFGYVPVYMLSNESNSAAGVFAAINYLSMPITLLGVAWGQASITSFALAAHDARMMRDRIGPAAVLFIAAGGVAFALGWWLGPWLLESLYGPIYAEAAAALPWLLLAASVSCVSTILSYASTAIDRLFWQPILLAVAIGVVVVSGQVLIPSFGITGAAVSLNLGYLVHAVMLAGHVFWCAAAARAASASAEA